MTTCEFQSRLIRGLLFVAKQPHTGMMVDAPARGPWVLDRHQVPDAASDADIEAAQAWVRELNSLPALPIT